jgi:hypothetical protein
LEQVSSAFAALHRDGASPRGALDLLYVIVNDETWRRVETQGGGHHATFTEFVETGQPFGLGVKTAELRKLVALRHPGEDVVETRERMTWLRSKVEELFAKDVEAIGSHGGPRQQDGGQERGTNLPRSDVAPRVLARLKRDAPELAERVVNREVSADAAAREMGWRRPRIVVSTPERIAKSLKRTMPPEDIARLVAILGEPS